MPDHTIIRVDGRLHRMDLYDMQEVCFPGEDQWLVDEGDWWLVLEDEEEPVGFACLTEGYKHPDIGYLALAGVMPEARGHGLQRRLIAVREQRARELGRKRLLTYTRQNPHSTMNLIRCGFEIYQTQHTDWAEQRQYPDALTLRKRLL
jgi:GNAT superfamily N-acetyltransferase